MSTPALPDTAKAAANAGHTVEAIKIVREETGCDLLSAKAAIDDYLTHADDAESTTPQPTVKPDDFPAEAVSLLEQGKLIDAIRVIRHAHGIGLKDAKEAAEQYLATHTLVRERYQAAAALSRNAAIHKLLNALLLLGSLCALLVWLGVLPWLN